MTNRKTTRRALVLSLLSLLLCCSMLVGTTFAWFTDSVTSGNNKIVAGNLDIELEYAKVENGKITDWDTVEGKENVFDPNALWEPGRVEVVYLKVSNLGTLTLKYQLGVNVAGEITSTSVLGNELKLSDHLVFKVVEMPDALTTYTDREAVAAAAGTEKGLKDYNGDTKTLDPLDPKVETNHTDYVALIVYMPETVGNEANYRGTRPEITLGVSLFATQKDAETDSFGPDYDEDAWVDAMIVMNEADLNAAVAAGGKVMLGANIELTKAAEIPAGVAVALNMNGKKLSSPNGYVFENQGELTVDGNGTFEGLGIIRSKAGKITIDNGNFYASSQWQNGVYQHTLKAENTDVVINGGVFDATVYGQTNAMFNASTNGTITINGGSFKNVAGALGNFDPYIFTYEKNGELIINDGTFYGGWRFNGETATTDIYGGNFTVGFDGQSFNANSTHVLTVYGGTFTEGAKLTDKLSDVVAPSYVAVDNGDTYTVLFPQESFDELISNAQPGETVAVPAGNFNLSGNNDLVIKGSGEDTVITFKNSIENVNISNATISGEPRLAVKSGQAAVFENVTFEGTKAWGSVQGTASFIGCTFEKLLHIDSSAETTTIKFTDCTFTETSIIKLGGSADYILDGCTVEKLADGVDGAWGKEWLITYCDTTFNKCELGRVIRAGSAVDIKLNGCTDPAGEPVTAAVVHKNAAPTVWVDGIPAVFNNDSLKALVNGGEMKVMLMDGEYDLNGIQKDGLTLTGIGTEVKVANTTKYASGKAEGAIWKAINLENVTITNTVYTMADGGNATFKNVNFAAGFRQGYGKSVKFEGCTFGSNSEDYALHFQTDAASEGGNIVLTECEFGGGKVHLGGKRAYTFSGCEFAEGTDFQVWSTITLENCTVNGEKVTAENAANFFPKLDLTKVTFQ